MNQSPSDPGIHLNTRTIGLIVGIITIIGASFATFEKINSYEVRLNRVEYNESIRTQEMSLLAQELKLLNNKITDLTIELREFRAANDAGKK